jgi:hypothetical protein
VSLWSRIKQRARSIVRRFTEPEPPPPSPPSSRGGYDYDREGYDRETGERESLLPDGWVLVGLYHDGEKTSRIHDTDGTEVTDSDIRSADAVIVWYPDAGSDGYRWIHGASGWDSIADQIDRVVTVVSPAGRGE